MKWSVIAVGLFCVILSLAFATGQAESEGVATDTEVTLAPGPVRQAGRWATPAEYTQQTGKTLPTYKESPLLASLVQAGELPAVEDRLPVEPLVVEPLEAIGTYGGRLTVPWRAENFWGLLTYAKDETLLRRGWENVDSVVLPNILKGWDLSDDARTISLYLREGMKWSNGDPFTADDFLFWYNDVLQNPNLTASIPDTWKPGGELMDLIRVNDYEVRLEFAVGFPGILQALSAQTGGAGVVGRGIVSPSRYLKQFHIDYNSEANDLANMEGYDHWYELFLAETQYGDWMNSADLPVVSFWMPQRFELDHLTFTRNPYYFMVDVEGNQLPYIDGALTAMAGDQNLLAAKVLDGEADAGIGVYAGGVGVEQLPVLAGVADRHNYRVSVGLPEPAWAAFEAGLFFNHTVNNPVIAALFAEPRFKQALSQAIDRDEVSQLVFRGLAAPAMGTTQGSSPYYEEELSMKYSEYDPDKARQLLDAIGLNEKRDGFRLGPNGEVVDLVVEIAPHVTSHPPVAELVKDYWEDVGLRTHINVTGGGEMWERFNANEAMIVIWQLDSSDHGTNMFQTSWWQMAQFWGLRWRQWFASNGEFGTEPPADVKEYNRIWSEMRFTPDEAERIRMGVRTQELLSEHLWYFGIVTPAPDVRFVRKTIGNVDLDRMPNMRNATAGMPTWYMKESE